MPDRSDFRQARVLAVLAAAAFALYGAFLASPPVFDDHWFFETASEDRLRSFFRLRWLPYASIDATRLLARESMVWLRLENLALHVANAFLLFLFLRALFEAAARQGALGARPARAPLPQPALAFAAALLFLVHPVAVYGVAYMIQRSTLMATTFALLTWLFFLKGVTSARQRWLLASAAAYLLAGFSKEHAIMAPAVSLALFVLLRAPGRAPLRQLAPVFSLYALVAALVVLQLKSGIVASAYEPNSAVLSKELRQEGLYPLSLLTQAFLFFKYLFLWLVPVTPMMSVDIREPLAHGLWSWPHTAGAAAFVLLPALAGWLLWRRGNAGLAGFGLLSAWLLFATELSTVRLQEVFVLYRAYFWMPLLGAAFPLLFEKLAARHALVVIALAAIALVPLAWNRLTTFSDPALLWDDALRLALKQPRPSGLGRMYHNRGVAHLNANRLHEAIRDFDQGIRHLPAHSLIYNDRAVAYLYLGRFKEALADFERAIWFNPNYYNPYLGRAKVHEAIGDIEAARRDYARSCRLGVTEACNK